MLTTFTHAHTHHSTREAARCPAAADSEGNSPHRQWKQFASVLRPRRASGAAPSGRPCGGRRCLENPECGWMMAAVRCLHRCGCAARLETGSVRVRGESLRPAAAAAAGGNGLRGAHAQRSGAATPSGGSAPPCGHQADRAGFGSVRDRMT